MQEMGWERGCLFCVVWMCKSGAADGATCSSNGSTPSAYVTVYVGGLISPHHTSLRAISAFYAMYYVYTTLNGRRLEQDRLYVNWRNHIWAEIKKRRSGHFYLLLMHWMKCKCSRAICYTQPTWADLPTILQENACCLFIYLFIFAGGKPAVLRACSIRLGGVSAGVTCIGSVPDLLV